MTPIEQQPLFADDKTRRSFPAPIAVVLEQMVSEISESGEATTADETALAIEATLLWLGRLWVAEYLHAIARDAGLADETLNRDLLDLARSSRPATTGRWVGMARRVRARLEGVETVVAGLHAVAFDDRVGQLLEFRNHFSHGSFASTVADIRLHRALLHDVLAALPALRTQAPLVRAPDGAGVVQATGAWSSAPAPMGEPLPEAHPVVVGAEGARLDLYPLLHASQATGTWTLETPNHAHPLTTLTERTALATWVARYQHEQQGHLGYRGAYAPADLPDGLAAELRSCLDGLVLVELPPGARGGAAVAALEPSDPRGLGLAAFAAVRQVRVVPGDLSQSGVTVGRLVLRMVEEALGEPDGSRAADAATLLDDGGPLETALADLAAGGKRVLLGLEDLHHGTVGYRGEAVTVQAVYEALANTAVTVVATTHAGLLPRTLFDHRLQPPPPDGLDAGALQAWLASAVDGRPLHRRVLEAVAAAPDGLHLFAACDALESAGGDIVFEPAVERALWDLQPVLSWSRDEVQLGEEAPAERVRVWTPFSPALVPAVAALGGVA